MPLLFFSGHPSTLAEAEAHMKTQTSFVLLLLVTLAFPAVAQEADGPPQAPPFLKLSIDDAVERALSNNVDLAVERYRPQTAREDIRAAEGSYDPALTLLIDNSSRTDPPRSFFTGGLRVTTETQNWDLGVNSLLKTGGTLSLTWNNSRSETNNVFTNFNPAFDTSVSFGITQPLLKDRKIDNARRQLRVAKNSAEISDVQFRQTVLNVIATVKRLYYDLIFTIDNLEAQRKSLDLARKLLKENRIKVRVGTLAPLDVVAAESEVASRDEQVIVAEAALEDAEDAIKQVIFPEHDPDMWRTRITPTDRVITTDYPDIDVEAATSRALEQRTDVVATRKSLENDQVNLDWANNQLKPGLNLEASYGGTGLGGTQVVRDPDGNIIGDKLGGYFDGLGQIGGQDFPNWRVGVRFSYPIHNRAARGSAARSRIAKDLAEASLRRLELQVAREVRTQARAVRTNAKRVQSSGAARILQQRRLDAEEKRFTAGMSTDFLVTQAQRDLVFAEVAELRAIADYGKSLIDFELVQEAGVGAGSGVILTGIGGSGVAAQQGQSLRGGASTLVPSLR